MDNYAFLESHCGKGYALVADKISRFKRENGAFPENAEVLDSYDSLTDNDLATLRGRAQLERKLDKEARQPQLILVRT